MASEPVDITLSELTGVFKPKDLEDSVRRRWEQIKLLELVKASKRGRPRLGFVEGPPTLNGEPHIGHVRGRV
ncbi:MAG: hypothetical protein HA494_04025, partial [Thaumarchaeota archaeon]|nr:hypothetical protein [Nitrososphaerota archaeon]